MMYEELAGYYDQLVGDEQAAADWEAWVTAWLKTGDVLDCACGNGRITSRLNRHLDMTGMDLSPAMIGQAYQTDPSICWKTGDMTNLEGYGKYVGITCLCDSINYLTEAEQLEAFFQEAWAHIKPEGLLLFDMHAADRLEEFADGWEETGTFEDGCQVQWEIQSEDGKVFQLFTFWLPDGSMVQENHVQRVWCPAEVEQLLTNTGFEVLDVTTDFDQPGIQPGEKYFYVCRRKS